MLKRSTFSYPHARKGDVVDIYHGISVPDPYRWLEEPDAEETQTFIAEQNTLTQAFLSEIAARETIKSRLTQLWNFPRYTPPNKEGGMYFYFKNDGLQNQSVLYRQATLDSEPILTLDPNTLSEDGTRAVINMEVSKDGTHIAYSVSTSGSDQQEIYIREIATGRVYDEVLQWGRFTPLAWLPDGSGFFYTRYPEPDSVPVEDRQAYNRLYLHKLGTPQSEDALVYERPDAKALNFPPTITHDERYIVLHVWHSTMNRNRLYYRELNGTGDFIRLIDEPDASYDFVGNDGSTFYILTDLDAPRSRVIAIDLDKPEREHWREIIPQGEDSIRYAGIYGGRILTMNQHHAAHELHLYHLDGTYEREIPLPTVGALFSLYGKPDGEEIFFDFTSFLYPPTVFRYVFATGELSVFKSPTVDFKVEDYETTRIFYESKDGTRVPMFLTYKKGLALNGDNPTLLYGYGGYNISMTPSFSVGTLEWIENGGVYAVACLRGGGEYGQEWHEAGMLEKKQNVFDDFIAAGEWLIANKYTQTKKLAIYGGSNGGLLVAACMLQRPELFGAVLCSVPVIDMLRYSKFTAGRYWVDEYGKAEDPAHFEFLMKYSPLHNVKPGVAYPPLLILTAESDDRVVPMHSFKFAAVIQDADEGENPLLLRVETKAGHGFGKPVSKIIDQQADMYAFLFRIFEMA